MTNYAADHMPDWSRKSRADRLLTLIEFVKKAHEPVTTKNFRRWLVELAFEMDTSAACSNGHDHGCNRGLGEWLGIEPYGQGLDGSVPWNKQIGFSSERLNRYADPAWVKALCASPLDEQKRMYVELLMSLHDTSQFVYLVAAPAYEMDDVTSG
jgi:hypothetical protein